MLLVIATLATGMVAGALMALIAHRWPRIEAPRIDPKQIAGELERHPRLRRHLLRHFDPRTETGLMLTAAVGVVIAAMAGIGILLAMIRTKTGLEHLDGKLAEIGAENHTPKSVRVLKWITELGGTQLVVILALVVVVFEYRRLPTRALPLFMTLVIGGQFALSNGIKYIVDRARPDLDPLTGFSGASFPSGHATAAAAAWACFALVMSRRRSRATKVALVFVATAVAVSVAGTRVFLGVHWFTDVLAGLLTGWGWFVLCSIAFGGRLLHFGDPVQQAEVLADSPTLARAVRDS